MIDGNVDLILKSKTNTTNAIGERISTWTDYKTIHGWLDFMGEATGRLTYKSKIVESTHVFVADFVDIDKKETELKAYFGTKEFDITYIDDPMNLHKQIEIFLKYVGD